MDILSSTWSPYFVGAGIGILSWFSFLVSRKALGTSTTYARMAGILEKKLLQEEADQKSYYQQIKLKIDWQWMLVIGIVLGSLLSALLTGDFHLSFLPETQYVSPVNMTVMGRFGSALMGGILLGFGSRLAGGCTSGHGISGTLQLAISSWLAAIFFFIGGIISALIIF